MGSGKSTFGKKLAKELALPFIDLDKAVEQRAKCTIGLTASNAQLTEAFRHENNIAFDYYYCDATTLKTMSRANPGILLLKAGNIVAKWPHRSLPTATEFEKYLK